jgi:hypothetical protein
MSTRARGARCRTRTGRRARLDFTRSADRTRSRHMGKSEMPCGSCRSYGRTERAHSSLENHRTVFHSYHKGFVVIHTMKKKERNTSRHTENIAHASNVVTMTMTLSLAHAHGG